jgi:4-hydroxy-tetrahydrodipicolinate synthase
LVPCGSNGEAPYLNREERRHVVETVVDEANSKALVIAGTGSISTWETIEFTKDAAEVGADAALIVTPFYFRHSNDEIQRHYWIVSEKVDLPIVVYSVPKFTGVSLEPSLIQKLAGENNKIIGIKDSSGDISTLTEIIRLTGDKIAVLAGAAAVTLPALQTGGKGAVLAVANVFPSLCSQLYRAFWDKKYETANKLQTTLSFANEVLTRTFNQISAIKEAMKFAGLEAGYPRLPTMPLNEQQGKTLHGLIQQINKQFENITQPQ